MHLATETGQGIIKYKIDTCCRILIVLYVIILINYFWIEVRPVR